jgi:hypothetical protein
MEVTPANIKMIQGSNYKVEWLLRNRDTNEVIPLTGFNARLQIRERLSSTTALYSADSAIDANLSVTPLEGKIVFTLTGVQTSTFNFNRAVYDAEIYDSSDNILRFIQGEVVLSKEVTR